MTIIKVTIAQEARKSGGDKYEGTTDKGETFSPYFPQSISRPNGKVIKNLKVTIEEDVDS